MTQSYQHESNGAAPSARPLDALRRADALVLGGALLVLIFSFLPQLHVSEGGFGSASRSMWRAVGLSELFPVVLLTLVIAALAALPLLRPADKDAPLLVATASQWAAVLSVVPVVTSVFALFFWHEAGGIGYGAYLVVLATLLVLAGTLGTALLPALTEPLKPARSASSAPATPDASGGSYVPAPAGWGQPPAPLQTEPAPAPETLAPPTTYAVTTPPAAEVLPEAFEPEPIAEPIAEPVGEPVAEPADTTTLFSSPEPVAPPVPAAQPFWACFPTVRPLVDGTTSTPVGQVTPDEWYLVTALDGRGATVQTTDGRIGLLTDVTGMVRAES